MRVEPPLIRRERRRHERDSSERDDDFDGDAVLVIFAISCDRYVHVCSSDVLW